LEELLRVEIYRRGLHSDAFGHANLRPGSPEGRPDLSSGTRSAEEEGCPLPQGDERPLPFAI
jgi:hypothetical protein